MKVQIPLSYADVVRRAEREIVVHEPITIQVIESVKFQSILDMIQFHLK